MLEKLVRFVSLYVLVHDFLLSYCPLFALKKVLDQMPLKKLAFSFHISFYLKTNVLPLARHCKIVI